MLLGDMRKTTTYLNIFAMVSPMLDKQTINNGIPMIAYTTVNI